MHEKTRRGGFAPVSTNELHDLIVKRGSRSDPRAGAPSPMQPGSGFHGTRNGIQDDGRLNDPFIIQPGNAVGAG